MLIVNSKNPLPAQIFFDEESLISLVSKTFGRKIRESQPVPYSFSNKTLKIVFDNGTVVIIKVSIKESRFCRIIMESGLIQELRRKTLIPLPEVLYSDFTQSKFQYPFVVYSFLPGTNLINAIDKIENKKKVGVELAQFASQIHQNKYDSAIFSLAKGIKCNSWKSLIQGVCTEGLAVLTEQGYKRTSDVKRYIDINLPLIEEPSSYSLIHRDLQPQNIHWNLEKNEISGIFDFEAAMSGDPLFEFAYLEMRLFRQYPEIRHSFYDTYSKSTALKPDFEQAVKFYEVARDLIYYPRDISYGELDRANIALASLEQNIFGD